MPETAIYKLDLHDAYQYSLVYEGHRRPDDLDEEGTIHQILVYDRARRLIKIENYFNGDPATEKTFEYENDRVKREREYFHDTGTANEIIYFYTPEGFRKEFYADGALEYTEKYRVNEKGVTTGFQVLSPDGEITRSWEANDKGDISLAREKDAVTTYEYVSNDDGLVREIIIRDNKQVVREVLHYKDKKLIKSESFKDGECIESTTIEYDAAGEAVSTRRFQGEVLVNETVRDDDPDHRYSIRLQKQVVAYRSSRTMSEEYRSGKVEILYDGDKRITDVLTSVDAYIDPASGINLEPNAYYFFEYEE